MTMPVVSVPCPWCGATKGLPCIGTQGTNIGKALFFWNERTQQFEFYYHQARYDAAAREGKSNA